MQTVLITGATSGIGLALAHHLHVRGFRVYGTSRFPEKHQPRLPFELLPLDLNAEASVRSCVAALEEKTKSIDVLINNAGMGVCGSAEETSLALAQQQLQTNFWGTVNLTKAILPLMRRQRSGRIITIGSLAGLIGVPFQSYYAASKHALEGFFKSLRFEVQPFNIKVSVIAPGFIKTNLHEAFTYATPSIPDYDRMREQSLVVFSESIRQAPPPDLVVHTVLKVIRAKDPRFSYRVGRDAKLLPWLQFVFTRLFERGTARHFKIPQPL